MSARPGGICAAAALAAALVTAIACGDPYHHTNPYDPATDVVVQLTGPDTVFSVGELAQYTLQSTPPFLGADAVWSSSSYDFRNAAPGQFQLWTPPLWPSTEAIELSVSVGRYDTTITTGAATGPVAKEVTLYRRFFTRIVTVSQRLIRLVLRCPSTHACDTLSAGGVWTIGVDGFDALDGQIVGLTNPAINPPTGLAIALFVSRDTSIAGATPVGIRGASVTARKTGTTWIIALRDNLRDSLKLVVR